VTIVIDPRTGPFLASCAVGSFTIAIDIGRTPDVVFAHVSDVATMPRWYEAVQQVRPLGGQQPGVGARYELSRNLPGGSVQNEVAVTEYEHGQLFTLESVTGPTPFRYRYTLEPTSSGTRLRLEGQITGAGLPGPIARVDSLTTQLFKRGMRANLQRLSALIEGG
jgi:Polyketide cyclase / dehydrase and lipid transport